MNVVTEYVTASPALITTATAVLIPAVVVVVGWLVVHGLNIREKRLNKRLELRVQYLVDAYRKLENLSGRDTPDLTEVRRVFEGAVADVQLFGTRAQIDALLPYLEELKRDASNPRIDLLLKLLRDDIRRELHLDQNVPEFHQFRFRPKAGRGTAATPP